MGDEIRTAIEDILDQDNLLQQILRASWPETWLQINLPLGSTRALLAIEDKDARTPGKVAEALGVSRTTVTGMLDRLESEGLLTRSIDPTDRRCFVLQLTPKAREIIGQLEGGRRKRLETSLAKLGPVALQALSQGLNALIAQMQSEEQEDRTKQGGHAQQESRAEKESAVSA